MRRPKSVAIFSLRRVEGKEAQLENYFKYNIRFGVITVIPVSLGVFSLVTIPFSVLSDTSGVIVVWVGFCGVFLGGIMAWQLRLISSRVLKDTSLDLSDVQKSAARKGLLLAIAAFLIVYVTCIAVETVAVAMMLTSHYAHSDTIPIVGGVLTIILLTAFIAWLLASSHRALKFCDLRVSPATDISEPSSGSQSRGCREAR